MEKIRHTPSYSLPEIQSFRFDLSLQFSLGQEETYGQKHGVLLLQKSISHVGHGIFFNFSQSSKIDFADGLHPWKRSQKIWPLSCLTTRAGGEWCLPQVGNTCSTSPLSPPPCSPPGPGPLLLFMQSALYPQGQTHSSTAYLFGQLNQLLCASVLFCFF